MVTPRSDARTEGPRVLIVDDHDLFAESLRMALSATGLDARRSPDIDDDTVLQFAEDGDGFDVVLLDLNLGSERATGIGLVEPLRKTGATVVMVTAADNPARRGECLEAGACSVVSKSQPLEVLLHATVEAASGRSINTPAERTELLVALRQERSEQEWRTERLERLTPAEREVLEMLCEGSSPDAIAQRRVVSIRTVRSQIESILTKLDVSSQLGAVAIANRARRAE